MIRMTPALIVAALLTIGCATVPFSRQPQDLPDNAYVEVLHSTDKEAIVGIRGVKVLRVELYARKSIYYPDLIQEGEWTTFRANRDECFNFVFLDPTDGKNHFAFVIERDNKRPPKWLSPRIRVVRDNDRGSCMAVR